MGVGDGVGWTGVGEREGTVIRVLAWLTLFLLAELIALAIALPWFVQ